MITKNCKNTNKLRKIRRTFLSCFILFFSLCLLIPAGALNSETDLENASYYYADVAKNHTIGGTYMSFIVEPKTSEDKLISTETEFRNLYGSFRESKVNFAGMINADKKNEILFPEVENDQNYSFLYVERAGFSNVEYQNAWKHEYYPIQLMFKGLHNSKGSYSFFYISQSDADILLDNEGLEKNIENYQSLLGRKTTIKFNGVDYIFTIADIYLETNYFYDALHEVAGKFFLGYNKFPNEFKKQAVFFLREYYYQNFYYLKYVKNNYKNSNFDFSIGKYNIKDNFVVDSTITNDIFSSKSQVLSVLFLVISVIFFLSSILLLFTDFECLRKIFIYVFILISMFLPYLIFKIIFVKTKNVYIFSSFTFNIYLIYLIVELITLCCFGIYLSSRKKRIIK